MSGNYTGRGNNAGPATELLPLSASSASSPGILITGTTAAGQTTVHTGDAFAKDVLYVTFSNVSAASITVYGNLGSSATTGQAQMTLTAGQNQMMFNANAQISGSGVFGAWSTATAGLYAYGYIARTYTATS